MLTTETTMKPMAQAIILGRWLKARGETVPDPLPRRTPVARAALFHCLEQAATEKGEAE